MDKLKYIALLAFTLVTTLKMLHQGLAQTNNGPNYLTIHEKEYLHGNGISVLAYHNNYFVGKQGAIEVIQQDRRIMTNGMLTYILKSDSMAATGQEFFDQPIPETEDVNRIMDHNGNRIILPFEKEEFNLDYRVVLKGEGKEFSITLEFDEIPDASKIEELVFSIELFPGIYRGKSFLMDNTPGMMPLVFTSNLLNINGQYRIEPLARGKHLIMAPDDEKARIEIKAEGADLELLDTRAHTDHYWYTLQARIKPAYVMTSQIRFTFVPSIDPDYIKPPVIGYSQTGYYPVQRKRSVIETDAGYRNDQKMTLYRLGVQGEFIEVLSKIPNVWGQYKRYQYLVFDFSDITEEGLYYLGFDEENRTNVFPVKKDFHKGVWEPVLHSFLPIQMCHMRVKDRNRIWHDHCHLDDAIQAPLNHRHFDGFSQGACSETPLKPLENFPGLNQGGWHDAGDDDVNTSSTGHTVYHLALMVEEFGVTSDQTTIDFEKKEVYMHRPDGKCDFIQNIIHGLNFILPQYEFAGHGIVGVISNDFETYFIPGTWESMTDNLHYNPDFAPDERSATHSGKMDDRFAFTNKDSRAEYRNVYVLAAAARVLRSHDEALAEKCLALAKNIWEREQNSEPVFFPSVGVPTDLQAEQVKAAAELYLSTNDYGYIEFIISKKDHILNHMESAGWAVSRLKNHIRDNRFMRDYEKQLITHNQQQNAIFSANPYGTFMEATLWGFGWDILWRTINHYFYIKNYPEVFSIDPLISCNEFMLGVHPYSSVSYVSGVGSQLPIPAFGMNRSHYSFTPGGVFSGVNIIEPDFPELMEDHPFIWQQSEYIIHGATPFIFTILGANQLINGCIK